MGWGSWTLARRLRTSLVALLLVLLAVGLGLVLVLRQADQALSEQSERTFPARLAASQLLTSLVDQETGLRGFVLTGDDTFLAPYRQGVVDEQAARAALERLVPPDDPARVSLLSVDAAITAWRDQYASLRTTGATGEDLGAGGDATIRFGRELFERVRVANADLDERLAAELVRAQRDADEDRRSVVVVLGTLVVAIAAAVVALQRALDRTVLRPLATLAGQVAVVSDGDHGAAIQPVGPPDIQEMASGVESMRLELVGALAEIEEAREGLERRATELARSNADLEQFAYVASHDLQEPLRKVSSFCQLLEQRYGEQLDDRARQYIGFAVDGSQRMQLLINDLLKFSRVGRTSEGFEPVDLGALVPGVWRDLHRLVDEVGGSLDVDLPPGPTLVLGDRSLLEMLLANLFGNALKYRRPDVAPVVRVAVAAEEGSDGALLRIDVADNGIGIPAEFEDKVFVIFQRLHGRDQYEGTGIGLALAKKIVEFHGGTIGLAHSPLGGACISFTLPPAPGPADD